MNASKNMYTLFQHTQKKDEEGAHTKKHIDEENEKKREKKKNANCVSWENFIAP